MNVFMYQSALLCESCGEAMRRELNGKGVDDVGQDSNGWPSGAYPDGGGEADSPQSCDHCNLFLCNPLTPDGVAYVTGRISDRPNDPICREWSNFYGIG